MWFFSVLRSDFIELTFQKERYFRIGPDCKEHESREVDHKGRKAPGKVHLFEDLGKLKALKKILMNFLMFEGKEEKVNGG